MYYLSAWNKQNYEWRNPPLAFALGFILSVVGLYFYQNLENISTSLSDEVHIHADFAIYINNERMDLTDNRYQSYSGHVLSEGVHLHDNEDKVIHVHAEDISLMDFLETLDIYMSKTCLTLDTGNNYCEDDRYVLELYVNKEIVENINDYEPKDEDQIMIYYGLVDNVKINQYLNSLTNDSCIYSGTCSERGIAPPESCGLTCEL